MRIIIVHSTQDIYVEQLEQCLVQSKFPINVSYVLPAAITIVIVNITTIITCSLANSRSSGRVGKDESVGLVLILALVFPSLGSGRGCFIFSVKLGGWTGPVHALFFTSRHRKWQLYEVCSVNAPPVAPIWPRGINNEHTVWEA